MVRCNSCFEEYDEALGMCPHCGYMEGERPDEPFCLVPGTVIHDRYVIGKMMGVGGFGITYKGWDNTLNTIVAIKEFYPSGLVNRLPGSNDVILVAAKREREFLYNKTRFLDEARNTARFSTHKNIVNVYDFFEAHNTVYMVMEFLDGETLGHMLKRKNAPLDYEYCVNVASSLCSALRAIHAVGILHRDIAPDNIMILKNGTVKLFDFGAARFSAEKAENSKVTVVVKPGFAPPEQYDKVNRQDGRTDIYALGATLYYVMTGTRPEESTNRKIEDLLVEPRAIIPEIPETISTAIMRAMAIEQQYRFANVDEFEKALLASKPVATVEKARKQKKRRRLISILACLLVVVAAGVGFLLMWDSEQVRGNLTLWYMETGDAEADAAKAEALNAIKDNFMAEYTDVTVTVEGVPQAGYADALAQARSEGRAPAIFESTGLAEGELGDVVDLSEQLQELSQTSYYDPDLAGNQYYPTSVVVPVLYVNTTLGAAPENAGNLDEVVDVSIAAGQSGLTKAEAQPLYIEVYGRSVGEVQPDARDQFAAGARFLYYGDTEDYTAIQEALPGQYTMRFPTTGTPVYRYGCTWSVSKLGRHEAKAAAALMDYFGTGFSQDYLHIRNQNAGLPINKDSLKTLTEIYGELEGAVAYMEQ